MKKILIFIFLWSSTTYADLSVTQIRNMVKKIHEKRVGISLSKLETTKEPFIKLLKKSKVDKYKKPKEVKLELSAILNDKAFINGSWISVDESVEGYVLQYIGAKGVVLRKKNKIKKLLLHGERKNLITVE